MQRLRFFTLEEGLEYIRTQPFQVLDGYQIEKTGNSGLTRYRLFEKNRVCIKCGVVGEYWYIERTPKCQPGQPFSVNLYGKRPSGDEVMLTHDHMIPKALGGSDNLVNAQCLCARCNSKKGATLTLQEMIEFGIHPNPLKMWKNAPTLRADQHIFATLNETISHFNNMHSGIGRYQDPGRMRPKPHVDVNGRAIGAGERYSCSMDMGSRLIVWHGHAEKFAERVHFKVTEQFTIDENEGTSFLSLKAGTLTNDAIMMVSGGTLYPIGD